MTTETQGPLGTTVEETAEKLSIPVEQVRDLIAAGALTTTGDGPALRVTPDSLLLYMTSRLTSDLKRLTQRPSAASAASSAFLPLVLGMWFLAACVMVFSVRGGEPIVPLVYAIPVLAAVLGLGFRMARASHDFHSMNGCGTTLYGRRLTPEGRIGTAWMIFAGVPLLPVRSYVILEATDEKANWSGMIRQRSFRLRSLPRIHWPQALPLLLAVWAGLAALVAAAVLTV